MLSLALLLALAQGPVAPPSIDVAPEFAADKIPVVYVRNVPVGADIQFSIDPEPAETRELKDGGLAIGCAPGTYTVTLDGLAIDWDKKQVKRFKDKKTFKRLGAGPDPKPDPGPDPKPDPKPDPNPKPTASVMKTIVIEDVENSSGNRAKFFSDPELMGFFDTAKCPQPRVLDKKNAAAAPYLPRCKSFPYTFILDEKNRELESLPLPATAAECLAKLNDLRSRFLVQHLKSLPADGEDGEGHCLVIDGQKRSLGLKPRLSKVGSKFAVFGMEADSTGSTPKVMPRDKWYEFDFKRHVKQIKDQNGVGACNAFAATSTFEICRVMRGLPWVECWPGELYGRINGGRDQGSMLEDALEQLQSAGVMPRPPNSAQYAWKSRPSDWKTQAAPYRAVDIFECPTFDHIASALLQGYVLDFGVMVGNNFAAGQDAWVPEYPSGGVGGHAMCAVGLASRLRNGKTQWGLVTLNSWGNWGDGGYCVVPETYFKGNQIGGHFAVRTVVDDATDLKASNRNPTATIPASAWTPPAAPVVAPAAAAPRFQWMQVCRNGKCRMELVEVSP